MSITGIYDTNNIFAKILRGEMPCIKIFEDKEVLAFMDIFPESKGHVLVVPKLAARNFLDISPEAIGPYLQRVQQIASAINEALKPNGIKIMQYNGAAASQTVFHVHFHIVPCYVGVPLAEHSSFMADREELEEVAVAIRAKL